MAYGAQCTLHSTNKSQWILISNASLCEVFNFAFVLSVERRQWRRQHKSPVAMHHPYLHGDCQTRQKERFLLRVPAFRDADNQFRIKFKIKFLIDCAGKLHCAVNWIGATMVGEWRLGERWQCNDRRYNLRKHDNVSGKYIVTYFNKRFEARKWRGEKDVWRYNVEHRKWLAHAMGIERFNEMLCKYKLHSWRLQRNHNALALASSIEQIALHLSCSLSRLQPLFSCANITERFRLYLSARHLILCGGKCQMHICS